MICRLLLLLVPALAWAAPSVAPAPNPELVYVLILSRHGIRSPLGANESIATYAPNPWPAWEVAPGILTPHGQRQMELMGAYYRADYTQRGLLTGRPADDAARIFYRADHDQRTLLSTEALGEGLTPGVPAVIHYFHSDKKDPLFSPNWAQLGHPSASLAQAAVLGQFGGKPELLIAEHRASFETLDRILLGGAIAPADKPVKLELLANLEQDMGTVHVAQRLAEAILLAYADAKPMAQVGWGRLQAADILPLTDLVSLGFVQYRTRYAAQASASNLAEHVLATLEQAAEGEPVAGALGHPSDRMAILGGHDSNVVALATLLGIHWQVPQAVSDLSLPGGALIFELYRNRGDGSFVVRMRYVSQTYDQMRANNVLSREFPPAISPIFVPDCSTATPEYDAPFDRFSAHLRSAIDPAFTTREPAEVQ